MGVTEVANTATTANVTTANSWLKTHETLVRDWFFGLILLFIAYKTFNSIDTIENHKYQQATATLTAQKQQNDEALSQAKATLAQYEQALQNASTENANLAIAISKRNDQVTVQQQSDAKLAPSQLATRLQGLIDNTGVQNTQSGFALTNDATLDIVEQLEQIPALKLDLTDEQTKEASTEKALTDANSVITQGKAIISGLQLQLTDQQKQCTIEVDKEKADARKSRLKWMGIGAILGFIGGHIW